MLDQWIEVFKAGAWTDSAGNTRTWTEADLDQILKASQGKEAPAVIGHPRTDSPAWGWIGSLKKDGGSIWVKFRDLVPEFAEMIKKKMFPNRSIALNADYSIRHVGFLGAVPPAVKGLAPIALASDAPPMAEIEFSDHAWHIRAVGSVFQKLREWIIEKFGAEAADKAVPGMEIDFLKTAEEDHPSQAYSKEEEENMPPITEEQLNQRLKEQETQFAAQIHSIEEARKKKDEEIARKEAEIKKREAQLAKQEIVNFCEGLKREGKFLPAWEKMGIIAFMEQLDAQPVEIEFAEGKKETSGTFFRRFLSEMSKSIEFSEIAPAEIGGQGAGAGGQEFAAPGEKVTVDPDRLDLHRKAVAYQRQNKISYAEAVRAVSR